MNTEHFNKEKLLDFQVILNILAVVFDIIYCPIIMKEIKTTKIICAARNAEGFVFRICCCGHAWSKWI